MHRPDTNCGPTARGGEPRPVAEWLQQHGQRSWDIIHFNFGLVSAHFHIINSTSTSLPSLFVFSLLFTFHYLSAAFP